MKRNNVYRIKVEARYKDYKPLTFSLDVKYIPNFDGKVLFVDLGTHVFFKNDNDRPKEPFQFEMVNVMDDGVEDDSDVYSLSLAEGPNEYYALKEQENKVTIPFVDSKSVPRTGESKVTVKAPDTPFLESSRQIFALPKMTTDIEIPLVSALQDGELAVVLTWTEGLTTSGSKAQVQNLDLHIEFQPEDDLLCTVDHAMRQCNGIKMTMDSLSSEGRVIQIQAAKLDVIGDFNYIVYASKSTFNLTNKAQATQRPIIAQLQVFSPHHKHAVYSINMPFLSN